MEIIGAFSSLATKVDSSDLRDSGSFESVIHYINGQFVEEKDLLLNPLDLGLLRGYGVFDYVQSHFGKLFHLENHLLRLQDSAASVGLSIPVTLEELANIARTLVSKNLRIYAGLRFVLTGGLAGPDLLTNSLNPCSLMILFHPTKALPERYYTAGMKVVTTQLLRLLPSVKSTNYMPAVLGMKTALSRGFDDALYMTKDMKLLEGTTSNLFFYKNGTWITDDSNLIVKGVTRKIILQLIKEHYLVEFRTLSLEEVSSCEEAFLCSTVKDVIPLVQIDDFVVGSGIPGFHTSFVRSLYRKYVGTFLSSSEK